MFEFEHMTDFVAGAIFCELVIRMRNDRVPNMQYIVGRLLPRQTSKRLTFFWMEEFLICYKNMHVARLVGKAECCHRCFAERFDEFINIVSITETDTGDVSR